MKFFWWTLIAVALVAAGWYYLPETAQKRTAAVADALFRRDTGELKNIIREATTIVSPEKKREELFAELRKNIATIKAGVVDRPGKPAAPLSVQEREELAKAAESAEKILVELEEAGAGPSLMDKIENKVVEVLLPANPAEKETAVCIQEENLL